MITILLGLIGGLIFLSGGAEALIRGSVGIANRFKLSPLLIGLTIVAFGTSAPELVASLKAAWDGNSGIAVGNVVGSNIMNILVILGLTALVRRTRVAREAWGRSGMVMLGVTVLAVGLFLFVGELSRWVGLLLVTLLAAYLTWEYRTHRRRAALGEAIEEPEVPENKLPTWANLGLLALGLFGLALGARLLVDAAVVLAQTWGVSDTVIGLTVIAFGTSLPELAASVMAALRKQPEIAVGNIIGSNIFNILCILGITAAVLPIPVPAEIIRFDMWVMLAAAVAFLVFSRFGWRLSRVEGGLFLAAYTVYVWFVVAQATAVPAAALANPLLYVG